MKQADGVIAKNDCSKATVKSKSSRLPMTVGPMTAPSFWQMIIAELVGRMVVTSNGYRRDTDIDRFGDREQLRVAAL